MGNCCRIGRQAGRNAEMKLRQVPAYVVNVWDANISRLHARGARRARCLCGCRQIAELQCPNVAVKGLLGGVGLYRMVCRVVCGCRMQIATYAERIKLSRVDDALQDYA